MSYGILLFSNEVSVIDKIGCYASIATIIGFLLTAIGCFLSVIRRKKNKKAEKSKPVIDIIEDSLVKAGPFIRITNTRPQKMIISSIEFSLKDYSVGRCYSGNNGADIYPPTMNPISIPKDSYKEIDMPTALFQAQINEFCYSEDAAEEFYKLLKNCKLEIQITTTAHEKISIKYDMTGEQFFNLVGFFRNE